MKKFLLGLTTGVIATLVIVGVASLSKNKGEVKTVYQELPECYVGKCPQYFNMDVDGR